MMCDDMHEFCAKGVSSWCNCQKAIALDTMPPKGSATKCNTDKMRERLLTKVKRTW